MSARARPLGRAWLAGAPLALAVVTAPACGSGTPPKPTVGVAPTASVRVAPSAPTEDRTKAPPPAGLLAELHVESPWSAAASLGAYAPRVFDKLDVGKLAEAVVGSPVLARRIDYRRPFDVVVAARARAKGRHEKADVAWAFAIDASDLEADLAGVFKLEPLAGGVRRLVPASGDRRDRDLARWRHACVVAPALGGAPYRLVCTFARENQALDHLAPWLARGVNAEPDAGAPIRARIDVAAIRHHFRDGYERARDEIESIAGERARTGRDELDRAIKRLGKRAGGDLFDFFDETSVIDFTADPRADTLAINAEARLASSNSWTARALLSTADAPGGARAEHRAVFLSDAHSGGYVRATKALAPLAKTLEDGAGELVDALAVELKWSAKDKAAYAALLPQLALGTLDRAWIDVKPTTAAGKPAPIEVGSSRPVDDYESYYSFGGKLERLLDRTTSSGITVEVEERPAKDVIDATKGFGALLARPSTTQALKALTDGALTLTAKVAPEAVKGLPAGGFAQKITLDLSIADAGSVRKGWPRKLELVQLVVPDGARTWTAFGRRVSGADALATLERARKGGATPLGLAPLLEPIGGGGGFVLLRALAAAVGGGSEAHDLLQKLPNSGNDPLILRLAATREGAGGTAKATLFLPRDVMASIGMGLQAAMRWIY